MCFQDDILLYGTSVEEHNTILAAVLQRLRLHGLTVKKKKCQINVDRVTYLGHLVTPEGVFPKPSLIEAVESAAIPRDKDALRSFLGLAEFYHKFVPHFAARTAPLRAILKANAHFNWSPECQLAFNDIQKAIATASALTAFDANMPTVITTDASQYGLGAVLSQKHGHVEKIVGYASRALTDPETRYSTIEREALACWWAMAHFRSYIWGAPFTVRTDHRPLLGLLSTHGSRRATTRIANWYAKMLEFQFTVEYVPGACNVQADCLSRMPMAGHKGCAASDQAPANRVCMIDDLSKGSYTKEEWVTALSGDHQLQRVMKYCIEGWPAKVQQMCPDVKTFWRIKDETCIYEDVLMRGERLIVPEAMRERILHLAHIGHKGISAVKRSMRELYWWEGMDKDAERMVRECLQCRLADKSKTVHAAPLIPIPAPDEVWDTVGIDIIGPISTLGEQQVYAITLIDYTSRWPEVMFVHKVDTATVISFLRATFSREGCPRNLISDNGVQFCSTEMLSFLSHLGIMHRKTSLYHPQGNGLVERLNRTVKDNLQLSVSSGTDWKVNMHSLLWSIRTTPNKVTGYSPFVLMRGRKELGPLSPGWVVPNTRVTVQWGKVAERNEFSKKVYKERYDKKRGVRDCELKAGDVVGVKKPWREQKGLSRYMGPLTIVKRGEKHVDTNDGKRWSVDRLVRWRMDKNGSDGIREDQGWETNEEVCGEKEEEERVTERELGEQSGENENTSREEEREQEETRTTRVRKMPTWYKDYDMT